MLSRKLATLLGSEIARTRPAAGGDINQVQQIELRDGRKLLVKSNAKHLPGMFSAEARGLSWLADARALRVPEVVLASEADELGPACLVLEWIESGPRARDYAEQLGAGLAALHRAGAPSFGLDYDNYLASLTQTNRASASWASFYAEQRVAALAQAAADSGELPRAVMQRIERVIARMPALVGPDEPPARLHGDLWGGNVLCDSAGAPVLIDPAVYGGQREVDLAIMRLFGGFSDAVFAAYAEAWPLSPGSAERVALYQLYPLLAHVNLFGAAYLPQLEHCIACIGIG